MYKYECKPFIYIKVHLMPPIGLQNDFHAEVAREGLGIFTVVVGGVFLSGWGVGL